MQVKTRVSNFYIHAHVNVMQNVSKYSLTKRFSVNVQNNYNNNNNNDNNKQGTCNTEMT